MVVACVVLLFDGGVVSCLLYVCFGSNARFFVSVRIFVHECAVVAHCRSLLPFVQLAEQEERARNIQNELEKVGEELNSLRARTGEQTEAMEQRAWAAEQVCSECGDSDVGVCVWQRRHVAVWEDVLVGFLLFVCIVDARSHTNHDRPLPKPMLLASN